MLYAWSIKGNQTKLILRKVIQNEEISVAVLNKPNLLGKKYYVTLKYISFGID